MKQYKRIFTVVLDSLGIGAMEDSEKYGDVGVDTLGHIAEQTKEFQIPNLRRLGIGNLKALQGVEPAKRPMGRYAALREKSLGKDTMTGHWEMMGLYITKPFQTFTDHGFPQELIDELSRRTGRVIIGNKSASGTEILEELAEEEIEKGHLIVYTSADSVLQICGNEETMGLDTLYHYCEIARELTMRDEWKVGRVIARPYVGRKKGEFVRTSNRHDYALKPYGRTVLNALKDGGFDVISVGKIFDIFDGEGLTESHKSKSSVHGMEQTLELARRDFTGLCFTNLVDFDALWGHRRNVQGYAEELERFDVKLGQLMETLGDEDLLILTADHGNDPTYTGTDHTREKVPFIAWSPSMEEGGALPEQETFAVIGATIAENFGVSMPEGCIGTSLLGILGESYSGAEKMTREELLRHLDHTLLAQTATWEEVKAVCEEGMRYKTASVCISPCYVKQAREYVGNRLPICTVIGFPNGAMTTAAKVFETEDAVKNGADEIDMVVNLGMVKAGNFDGVLEEIREVRKACSGRVLKVIIETCLLTEQEKIELCRMVTESGADYIKTSTGFSTGGATFEDVRLMKKYVGEKVKIKAAGGIHSCSDAEAFLRLGADRLGTSRLIRIMEEEKEKEI